MLGVHVALNLTFLVPGETGGSETYARALVPALRRVRPDARLTALASPELHEELRSSPWCDGLELVRLPVSGRTRVRRTLAEQTVVPVAARRAGARVLHSLATTAPALHPGLASVVTIHDLIYKTIPETHAGMLTRGMEVLVPLSARTSDAIIAISEHVKGELVRHLGVPAAKVHVVPHGPGADAAVAPTPEAELRRRFELGDRPLVLSVSARRPHKNLERLIDAMAAGGDGALLVLPGYPGPHDEVLRARGGDAVRVLGWVSDADLEGLYRASACLAFPSLAEGFGLPVLEAMRRGLPVACADATSLPEVAGDAAVLFDPLDTGAIAAAIGRLLGDPELRADLARRGLERAAEFSWERAAHGTFAAYEAALAATSERPARS